MASLCCKLVISWRLFHPKTSYLVRRYNPIKRIQWPKCRWPWPKVKVKVKFCQKKYKKLINWPYLRCYFTYSLHTWYQGTTHKCASNDPSAYDVDQRSRSKVKAKFSQKCVKKQRTGHISEAISPTDFILGIKVQPNKAHSMTQVLMTVTEGKGEGQILLKMVKN